MPTIGCCQKGVSSNGNHAPTEGVWPRLQSSHEKPHWITLDFNHFEYQHDGSEEEDGVEDEEKEIDPELRKKMVCWLRA